MGNQGSMASEVRSLHKAGPSPLALRRRRGPLDITQHELVVLAADKTSFVSLLHRDLIPVSPDRFKVQAGWIVHQDIGHCYAASSLPPRRTLVEAVRSLDNHRWCVTSDGLVVFTAYPLTPLGFSISVWKPSREWHAPPATPLQVAQPPKTYLVALASAGTRVLALMDEDMRGELGVYQLSLDGDTDQPLRRLASIREISLSPSAHSAHSEALGHMAVLCGESSVLVWAPDRPDAARQLSTIEIGAADRDNPVDAGPSTPPSVAALGTTLLVARSNSLTVIDLRPSPPAVRGHRPALTHSPTLRCVGASMRLRSPNVAILLAMFADGQLVVEAIDDAGGVLWHKELRDSTRACGRSVAM